MSKKTVSQLLTEGTTYVDVLFSGLLGQTTKEEYNEYLKQKYKLEWESLQETIKNPFIVETPVEGYSYKPLFKNMSFEEYKYVEELENSNVAWKQQQAKNRLEELGDTKVLTKEGSFPRLEFLNKILEDVGGKGFICGGCFKHIFLNKEVRDIDVYFETTEDYLKAVERMNSNPNYMMGYTHLPEEKIRENYAKNVGIMGWLKQQEEIGVTGFKDIKTGLIVELIGFNTGTPEKILYNFDFTVCMFGYKLNKGKPTIYFADRFLYDLVCKNLVFNSYFYKNASDIRKTLLFGRMLKYRGYGFEVSPIVQKVVLEHVQNYKGNISELMSSEGVYASMDENIKY